MAKNELKIKSIQAKVYEGQAGYVKAENKLSHKEQLADDFVKWLNNNVDADLAIVNECYEWYNDDDVEHVYLEDVIRTLKDQDVDIDINSECLDYYARCINFGHPDIYVEVHHG